MNIKKTYFDPIFKELIVKLIIIEHVILSTFVYKFY